MVAVCGSPEDSVPGAVMHKTGGYSQVDAADRVHPIVDITIGSPGRRYEKSGDYLESNTTALKCCI